MCVNAWGRPSLQKETPVNRTTLTVAIATTISLAAASAALAATPAHFNGAQLMSQAKVSLPQARAIARR